MKIATPLLLLLVVALSEALPSSHVGPTTLPPAAEKIMEEDADVDDADPNVDDNLEKFEEFFNEAKIEDPDEKEKREESLEEAEAEEKKENLEFVEGEAEFFEELGPYSDLTKKEFEDERTGLDSAQAQARSTGLLEDGAVDEEAEAYYDRFRNDRSEPPASYSAVEEGWVTSSDVRNQGKCGSCAAFASLAVIEIVFAKQTERIGDYSEQELIDCGYDEGKSYHVLALGCGGASLQAYMVYAYNSHLPLTAEVDYPYLSNATKTCPRESLNPYNIGAALSKPHWITNEAPDEETMKKIVYEMGAVSTGVYASDKAFQNYAGGIFSGCTDKAVNHAVAVVGYGTTDEGEDYWLIKNSWGADWGEGGFMRIKRGVGMCKIGTSWATIESEKTPKPWDPEKVTVKPCVDKYSNCPKLAETNCFDHQENCPKSCGMCDGMTKHSSLTCFDRFTNCKTYADVDMKCYQPNIGASCKISCGLCPGLERHPSNDPPAPDPCFKTYSNCDSLAMYCKYGSIANACPGTCLDMCK